MPNFSKILSSKHHFVIEDWKRLAPTKAVNHNQFWSTFNARIKLIRINEPATALIILCFIQYYFKCFSIGITIPWIGFTGFISLLKIASLFSTVSISVSGAKVKYNLESMVSLLEENQLSIISEGICNLCPFIGKVLYVSMLEFLKIVQTFFSCSTMEVTINNFILFVCVFVFFSHIIH